MKDSPTPPDPYRTAQSQTDSNVATARANQGVNMVNQVNPFGSLTYSRNAPTFNPGAPGSGNMGGGKSNGYPGGDGGAGGGSPYPGEYTATTALSAPMQGIYDKSTGLANTLLSNGEGALSGHGPDLSYGATEANLNALDAKRLDPQWAQNSNHEEATLYNRGLRPGTEAYDNEMRVFNQGKNDAYTSSLSKNHGQAVSDIMQQWNAPASALGSAFGVAKGTNPQFTSTPSTNVAGTNIAGLVSDNYRNESANVNAANGQMAGLIGTGLGAAGMALGGPFGGMAGSAMGGLFGGGASQQNPYGSVPRAGVNF